MEKVTIWHNPKCSKSRASMSLLEERELEIDVVKYLETVPTKDEIKEVLTMLSMNSARELMRIKEDIYKELNLADEIDEELLIAAMVKNPKLIERPIVIRGNEATIGRPIENVVELLG